MNSTALSVFEQDFVSKLVGIALKPVIKHGLNYTIPANFLGKWGFCTHYYTVATKLNTEYSKIMSFLCFMKMSGQETAAEEEAVVSTHVFLEPTLGRDCVTQCPTFKKRIKRSSCSQCPYIWLVAHREIFPPHKKMPFSSSESDINWKSTCSYLIQVITRCQHRGWTPHLEISTALLLN